MLVSMIFFLFVNTDVVWLRVASRILFVPFIAGISFEIIRWAGISKSPIVKILSFPGLMLQHVTTAVPDDGQIEVAIAALNGVLQAEEHEKGSATLNDMRMWAREELGGVFADEHDCNTDVDALLMFAADIKDYNEFLLKRSDVIDYEKAHKFKNFIARRKAHEPVQYILGGWVFMDFKLNLTRDVLIPRSDTETLVNAVLERQTDGGRGLEIGVGSGAVSIALKQGGGFEMRGTDICPKAVKLANENFAHTHGSNGQFVQGDLFQNVPTDEKFDFIVSNPPYIPTADIEGLDKSVRDYEPKGALDGGADGLDFYRRIATEASNWLNSGGGIYFEIGHDQAEDVQTILRNKKFSDINVLQDLAGRDRVVYGKYGVN